MTTYIFRGLAGLGLGTRYVWHHSHHSSVSMLSFTLFQPNRGWNSQTPLRNEAKWVQHIVLLVLDEARTQSNLVEKFENGRGRLFRPLTNSNFAFISLDRNHAHGQALRVCNTRHCTLENACFPLLRLTCLLASSIPACSY